MEARRRLPKAMMLSLAVSMVLYVLVCIVLTGMQRYSELNPSSGISSTFRSVGLSGLANVIAVGAVIGIVAVTFSFMMGAARLWYALSRDGLMPAWFGALHPKREVPHRATWLIGAVSAVLAGLLPINTVAELTNIGVLLAFVVVSASVLVLRYKKPQLARGFRCPGMPVVPILGMVFSVWLMSFLQWQTWARLGCWEDHHRVLTVPSGAGTARCRAPRAAGSPVPRRAADCCSRCGAGPAPCGARPVG